jgi:transposase|tara:strand:- start:209 stop:712 length:504 start_codon:yes stop_codon:yes gene_type:complete
MDPFPPSPGGGQEIEHGYKGKGVLLHLLIDGLGNPLAITTTAANGAERKEVEKLITSLETLRKPKEGMIILEADKGYDADWLRRSLLSANIFPLIPYRKIRGRKFPSMKEICTTFHLFRKRWMVERAFAWLKRRCRRLLMRWERIAVIWKGFATLGLIYTWMKVLFG